ncbi:MAG: hypothetical protein QW683_08665 [Candidatus Caldarchaeum sp.]
MDMIAKAQANLDAQGFGGATGILIQISHHGDLLVTDDHDGGEYNFRALEVLERIQAETYDEVWDAIRKYAI